MKRNILPVLEVYNYIDDGCPMLMIQLPLSDNRMFRCYFGKKNFGWLTFMARDGQKNWITYRKKELLINLLETMEHRRDWFTLKLLLMFMHPHPLQVIHLIYSILYPRIYQKVALQTRQEQLKAHFNESSISIKVNFNPYE